MQIHPSMSDNAKWLAFTVGRVIDPYLATPICNLILLVASKA
jgi:hypothetical protein